MFLALQNFSLIYGIHKAVPVGHGVLGFSSLIFPCVRVRGVWPLCTDCKFLSTSSLPSVLEHAYSRVFLLPPPPLPFRCLEFSICFIPLLNIQYCGLVSFGLLIPAPWTTILYVANSSKLSLTSLRGELDSLLCSSLLCKTLERQASETLAGPNTASHFPCFLIWQKIVLGFLSLYTYFTLPTLTVFVEYDL